MLIAVTLGVVAVTSDPTPVRSLLISAGMICLVPLVLSLVMTSRGLLGDRFIYHRWQRHRFYALSLISMLCGAGALWVVPTSAEMRTAATTAVVTLGAVMVVNLRIKVSIHALGAALTLLVVPVHTAVAAGSLWGVLVALGAAGVWGAACFARVYQHRHTIGEVVWGSVMGALAGGVYLMLTGVPEMLW